MKHIKLFEEFVNERTFEDGQIAIYDGEDGLTYIERRGKGYYGYNDEFDFEAKDKADLEKKLKSWKYKLISGSIDENATDLNEGGGTLKVEKEKDGKYYWTFTFKSGKVEKWPNGFATSAEAQKDFMYRSKHLKEGTFNSKREIAIYSTKNLEPISEGKREINKVVTVWKKMGVTDLNTIAKLYSDAMTDANFHQETATSKAIGAASKAKLAGLKGSDIASASGWEGSAIAHGTVEYLKSIGEEVVSQKLLKTVNGFVSPNGVKTLE